MNRTQIREARRTLGPFRTQELVGAPQSEPTILVGATPVIPSLLAGEADNAKVGIPSQVTPSPGLNTMNWSGEQGTPDRGSWKRRWPVEDLSTFNSPNCWPVPDTRPRHGSKPLGRPSVRLSEPLRGSPGDEVGHRNVRYPDGRGSDSSPRESMENRTSRVGNWSVPLERADPKGRSFPGQPTPKVGTG